MNLLRLGVLLAAAWTVLALAFLYLKAKSYGKRTLYSKPAQDPRPGIVYAFTKGMAPWAKESVMMNLPSYGAGMAFHAGVLTGFGLLLAFAVGIAACRILATVGATWRMSTTPRSRWCAIPAPTAKNDARISGYSGEKPCEPRVPGTGVINSPLVPAPK